MPKSTLGLKRNASLVVLLWFGCANLAVALFGLLVGGRIWNLYHLWLIVATSLDLRMWYREDVCLSPNQEKVRCFVHHEELATIQCTVCVSQNRLGKMSCYCSISCYKAAWDKHKVHHHFAAPNPDPQAVKIIKSFGPYGSYPDLPDYQDDGSQPDEMVEQDGKTWIEVGSSEYYVPTENDIGFCLRLKLEVVDSSTRTQLFPARIKVTDPVIYPLPHPPRCTMWNSCSGDLKEQSSNDVTFSKTCMLNRKTCYGESYQEDVCLSSNQEKIRCFVHHDELATIQCTVCASQSRLGKISYYCSISCYKAAWDKHKVHHHFAAPNPDPQAVNIIKSFGPYGSYPDLPYYQYDGSQPDVMVEEDGKTWIQVGSSEYYVPTENDIGFCLRLKLEVVDSSTRTQLFPARIKVTDPVIYPPPHPPRCTMWNSCYADLKEHASNDVTFKQNLLYEIIEYDADILCLQEVQKDHFENFLKPELAKYGYSVIYKKKKFELEFNNSAKPFVDSLADKQKSEARRLLKVVTLIHALEKIAKLKIPLLICADLNYVPQSDPYTFISKGRVEILPSKETDQSGILQTLKLSHSLNLLSAYATFFQSDGVKDHQREKMNPRTKEPLFTNFTPSFFGTIDYIFYTGTIIHDFYSVSDFSDKVRPNICFL
ncbi:hypothetical protein C1H46_025618 [Malus baccata]|uniref:Endonuclease/exonuclease/phosphatase domain-containing protein n=1 Tax=Malus baccata TaxID=106549 RepID=A0A540LQU8_MALBA|nr:hypothetical protein C1H46_025618 [Malus baccata]